MKPLKKRIEHSVPSNSGAKKGLSEADAMRYAPRAMRFLIIIGLLQNSIVFCQIPVTSLLTTGQTDTIIANHYFKKADSLSRSGQYDSAIYYFQKASVIYEKIENREKLCIMLQSNREVF